MIIRNEEYDENSFSNNDLYFFAVGYEHRSYYLYDRIMALFPSVTPTVFVMNDYSNYPHTQLKVSEIQKRNDPIVYCDYKDWKSVSNTILNVVQERINASDSVTVHIDYSSMPRSWYCRMPSLIETVIRKTDKVYFWYSEGEYPSTYEEYPCAGIESFSAFSGKPSLQIEKSRIHVLGLGYDVIRSQAILSIADPEYLVVCFAYNKKRKGFQESIKEVNKAVISRSAMILSLQIDDFEFMVSKLCETANDLLPTGDVILIPDGPKPLVFAMSLVPEMLNKNGITCLHLSRNTDYYEPVDVEPTQLVHGFSVCVV